MDKEYLDVLKQDDGFKLFYSKLVQQIATIIKAPVLYREAAAQIIVDSKPKPDTNIPDEIVAFAAAQAALLAATEITSNSLIEANKAALVRILRQQAQHEQHAGDDDASSTA